MAFLFLAAAGGLLYPACSAYGTPCGGSNPQCCSGLVCTDGLCNQPAGQCDNMPPLWQNPQVVSGNGSPGSPYQAVQNQVAGNSNATIASSSELFKQGWFSDWNALGLLGVMITIIIIAIAAMIGQAFNLTEVKAFSRAELMQAVISLLLIAGLMGLVQFFDLVAIQTIDTMHLPVACTPTQPCYITAAITYMDNVQDVANQYSQNTLQESFERMRVAQRGANVQFNVWYMAFAGATTQWNAGESIQAERAGTLFEMLAKLIVSLYAQKYFLQVVSFGIAPVLLLLGIILRTFFFTRKLGGLLLAIAISLFIVYPLTFTFAWFTLNVTVYGERSIATNDPACPSECTATYPVAFYTNSTGAIIQFETTQDIMLAGINQTNWGTGDVDGNGVPEYPGLVACRNLSQSNIPSSVAPPACVGCPDYCREVPFPASLPGCNITNCSTCNAGCKIMRQRYDCAAACDPNSCSSDCLTVQPVENKCYYNTSATGTPPAVQADLSVNCSACDACPNWCKIIYKNPNGQYGLVNKNEAPCQVPACLLNGTTMVNSTGATINGVCPMNCLYVAGILGSDNSCDALCTDPSTGAICPNYCRIQNLTSLSIYDTGNPQLIPQCTGSDFTTACAICPDACKIKVLPENETTNLSLCAPYPVLAPTVENCTMCPSYCRFDSYANYTNFSNILTNESDSTFPQMCGQQAIMGLNCSPSSCSGLCRSVTTPTLCEKYNASAAIVKYCDMCPEETRGLALIHNTSGGSTETVAPVYSAPVIAGCQNAVCDPVCKAQMNLTVPAQCNAYSPSATVPSLCNMCPEEVRGLSLHHVNSDGSQQTVAPALSPAIDSACSGSSCDAYCQRSETTEVPNATSNPACRDVSSGTNTETKYNDITIHGSGAAAVSLPFAPTAGTGSLKVDAQTVAGKNISVTLNGLWLGNMSSGSQTWSGLSNLVAGANNVVFASQSALENITNVTITALYSDQYNCSVCPIACRVNFAGSWLDPSCDIPACNANCSSACKAAALPPSSVRSCKDYTGASQNDCQSCPTRCRLMMSNQSWLDPGCDIPACNTTCNPSIPGAACCDSECKADSSSMKPLLCMGYKGAGPVDWSTYSCVGGAGCNAFTDNVTCATNGCVWSIGVPDTGTGISTRQAPYNDPSNCQQCPENCRVRYDDNVHAYVDSCGEPPGNASGVDCSLSSCPMGCRAAMPTPAPPASLPSICQAADFYSGSCLNCPVFCRRLSISSPPEDLQACDAQYCSEENCTDDCRMPDPPKMMCGGCVECPSDCLYTPPTRTDCTEVCSEEALAGPLNVGPEDFIKNLPGAAGKEDAKGVGVLMVPALVLPLFGLVMVIAFIHVLSPILGGEIDIPGLGRII